MQLLNDIVIQNTYVLPLQSLQYTSIWPHAGKVAAEAPDFCLVKGKKKTEQGPIASVLFIRKTQVFHKAASKRLFVSESLNLCLFSRNQLLLTDVLSPQL